MNILLTGASGFIGSHLCASSATRGHTVTALSRGGRAVEGVTRSVVWDPMSGPPPAEAFAGVDAVVNLMGESLQGRWTKAKKLRILESRVVGTKHLVEGIRAANPRPKMLVSGSAVGIYGNRGDEVQTEDSPPGDGYLADVCWAWEAEAGKARDAGVRVVRLRTGLVLGRELGVLG